MTIFGLQKFRKHFWFCFLYEFVGGSLQGLRSGNCCCWRLSETDIIFKKQNIKPESSKVAWSGTQNSPGRLHAIHGLYDVHGYCSSIELGTMIPYGLSNLLQWIIGNWRYARAHHIYVTSYVIKLATEIYPGISSISCISLFQDTKTLVEH